MVKKVEQELMQTLAIGMPNKPLIKGFSLIEMLLVVLIMSITFTFALLAFGDFGGTKLARSTALQFKHFIALSQQQAIFQASPVGIILSSKGYLALRYESDNSWQPLRANIFRYHAFSSKIIVSSNLAQKDPKLPNLIIHPSGDITPFVVTFATSNQAVMIIKGEHDGRLYSEAAKS